MLEYLLDYLPYAFLVAVMFGCLSHVMRFVETERTAGGEPPNPGQPQ